jgi:hypothetical protein
MAGVLFPRRSQPVNNKLGGISVQTSLRGIAIPWWRGRNRGSPNLGWYGDFIAKKISNKSGKGGILGGTKGTQQYDYGAALIMFLAESEIRAIGHTWDTQGVLRVNETSENYTVPVGGGTYTVTHTATFLNDSGCTEESAFSFSVNDFGSPGPVTLTGIQQIPMAPEGGSPSAGKYHEHSNGKYDFSAADAGKRITINYTFGPPFSSTGPDPITSLNLSLFNGAQGQSPWGYLLSKHPSEARGYTLLSFLATELLDLGSSGALPNLSFEAYAEGAYGDGSGDCDPKKLILDACTDPLTGIGIDPSEFDSLDSYSNYCVANGLLFSPFCNEQRMLRDYVSEWLEASNSELIQSGALLRVVPYGDTTVVANGKTYSPPSPIYDLDDDDFMPVGDAKPVGVRRPGPQQVPNAVRVQFKDRANAYNPGGPVEAQDQLAIERYGHRPDATRSFDFITTQRTAAIVAQQILQRKMAIRNAPKVQVDFRYCLLDPMDLNTFTDPRLGYKKKPLRIASVSEQENHALIFELEDFPWGAAGPTLYPKQPGSGGGPNANVDPGPIGKVAILEANTAMRGADSRQELWIFACGQDLETWGGCIVAISIDGGDTYPPELAGTLRANSTLGTLDGDYPVGTDPDSTHGLKALFGPGSGMRAFSVAEENSLASIAVIGPAGGATAYRLTSYELVAFGNASIIGSVSGEDRWDLLPGGGTPFVRRALKGSRAIDHPDGSTFALVDGEMFVFELDPSLAGKVLYFKFLGFNKHGNMQQSIADVSPYTFTPASLDPGLWNQGYTVTPLFCLFQDLVTNTKLNVIPFAIAGTGGSASYLGKTFSGLLNTAKYFVTVYDPAFTGENVALGLAKNYFCGTTPAAVHYGEPGYYYLGALQMVTGVPPPPPPPPDPGDGGGGGPKTPILI